MWFGLMNWKLKLLYRSYFCSNHKNKDYWTQKWLISESTVGLTTCRALCKLKAVVWDAKFAHHIMIIYNLLKSFASKSHQIWTNELASRVLEKAIQLFVVTLSERIWLFLLLFLFLFFLQGLDLTCLGHRIGSLFFWVTIVCCFFFSPSFSFSLNYFACFYIFLSHTAAKLDINQIVSTTETLYHKKIYFKSVLRLKLFIREIGLIYDAIRLKLCLYFKIPKCLETRTYMYNMCWVIQSG